MGRGLRRHQCAHVGGCAGRGGWVLDRIGLEGDAVRDGKSAQPMAGLKSDNNA